MPGDRNATSITMPATGRETRHFTALEHGGSETGHRERVRVGASCVEDPPGASGSQLETQRRPGTGLGLDRVHLTYGEAPLPGAVPRLPLGHPPYPL